MRIIKKITHGNVTGSRNTLHRYCDIAIYVVNTALPPSKMIKYKPFDITADEMRELGRKQAQPMGMIVPFQPCLQEAVKI